MDFFEELSKEDLAAVAEMERQSTNSDEPLSKRPRSQNS